MLMKAMQNEVVLGFAMEMAFTTPHVAPARMMSKHVFSNYPSLREKCGEFNWAIHTPKNAIIYPAASVSPVVYRWMGCD